MSSILDFRELYFCVAYLPANNVRRMATTYLRGYWKGSDNGRVVTIVPIPGKKNKETSGSQYLISEKGAIAAILWWLNVHLHIQSNSIIIKVRSSIPAMPRCTQYNFMLWGLSEWCISLDTAVSPTKTKMIPRILFKWCCGWFYISITINPIVRLCSVILPIFILLYFDFIWLRA